MGWREAFRLSNQSKNRSMSSALREEMNGLIGKKTFNLMHESLKRFPPRVFISPKDVEYIVKETLCSGNRNETIIQKLKSKSNYESQEDFEYSVKLISNMARVNFERARCQTYGLNWYVWRACGGTRGDGRTRKSHRNISDVIINWNDPPSPEELVGEISIGNYHAGEIEGCRCCASPIIDLSSLSWPMKIYQNGSIEKINKTNFKKIFDKNYVPKKNCNGMKYCKHCNQQVCGKRPIGWLFLLIMCLFTGGFWLILYTPYYVFFKSSLCPICKGKL